MISQKRVQEGMSTLRRGFKIVSEIGNERNLLDALSGLIDYNLKFNKELAVELLAAMINHPACDRELARRADEIRNRLGVETSTEWYQSAFERGRAWDTNNTAALILERLS